MMKARGVIFPEVGRAVIDEVEIPDPGPKDILVRIHTSGVSVGTERWMLKGKLGIPGEIIFGFPHAAGYQAAGTVAAVGKDVTGFAEGDRVFSRACKQPEGWKGSWFGGHMEYHVIDPVRDVIQVPETMDFVSASNLLLAQVGYNGASKPAVKPGDLAVVIGDGLVGQFASQALRARGVSTVLSGLSKVKLDYARRFSADEVYDNGNFDFKEWFTERYPEGADIVVETASTGKTIREAAELARRWGQVVLNGFYPEGESCIDWHWIRRKELTLYCADSRTNERLAATMELIAAGKMKVKELVAEVLEPEEVPEVYSRIYRAEGSGADYMGMVIQWTEEER
jgi:2-desacetyl-2-hydroxyethyl bacteriochlorophyllide A dehydrogenase